MDFMKVDSSSTWSALFPSSPDAKGPYQPSLESTTLALHSLIVPQGVAAQRATTPLAVALPRREGRSTFVAWTMCVNFLVGACLLSVPNAFAKAGIPASLLLLILVTIACYVTACYLIEVQSRANALVRNLEQAKRNLRRMAFKLPGDPISPSGNDVPLRASSNPLILLPQSVRQSALRRLGLLQRPPLEVAIPDDSQPADSSAADAVPEGRDEVVDYSRKCIAADRVRRKAHDFPCHFSAFPPRLEDYEITDCVFEINELCKIFIGPVGQHLWEICVIAWVYICLWLYLAIMAQTALTAVPLPGLTSYGECDVYTSTQLSAHCSLAYNIWLGVVWLLMLPPVLMDLRDLGSLQLVLNGLLYVVVGTMIVTVWVAMARAPYDSALVATSSAPFFAPQAIFRPEGFSLLFSTIVFGQMGHIGVPSIISVLQEKAQSKRVWLYGFLTNAALQTLLASTCVLFFGSHTSPISTLNWRDYSGGHPSGSAPAWASIISWLVVMMPVITISAGYPLQSGALANNLLHAVPKRAWNAVFGFCRTTKPDGATDPLLSTATSESSSDEPWPPLRVKIAAKLLTVVPPLLPALLVKDASKITRVGGLVGFLLSLMIPCILQWRSVRIFHSLWPSARHAACTPYSSFFSSPWWVLLILIISVVAFLYSVYDTFGKLAG